VINAAEEALAASLVTHLPENLATSQWYCSVPMDLINISLILPHSHLHLFSSVRPNMSPKTIDRVTLGTLLSLLNLRGLYILGFSFIFGMSLWVTFIGGIVTYKALPRNQFSALQQRIFPIYFELNALVSSVLLLAWIYDHDLAIAHFAYPTVPDVAQAYALALVSVSQALNFFWFGPTTSKLLVARLKLEKAEGKDAHDANVSADMKALNAKFARLHGYSSLANLVAFLALGFHGLWIGTYGTTA